MFSGQGLVLTYSWFTRHLVYQWTPLVFLFFYLAFNEKKSMKKRILYSILAGAVIALQFMSGGLNYAMFMVFPLMVVPIVYLIGGNFKWRLVKAIILLVIFGVFFFGIFAIKALPMLEFSEVSSKQSDYSLEEMIGNKIEVKGIVDFFNIFINKHLLKYTVATNIGLLAFILVLFSLFKLKKRTVMTFWIIAVLIFLVSIGYKPLLYMFWKFIPGLSKLHHVARAFYLLQFAAAVLAGIGATILFSKLKKIIKNAKIVNLIYILLVLGLVVELGFIENVVAEQNTPSTWDKYDFNEQLKENNLINYIAEDDGIFRINQRSL